MNEIKIPKEQIIESVTSDFDEKLKVVSEAFGYKLKVESVEWTDEGITIKLED